jgi:hypothetical protein
MQDLAAVCPRERAELALGAVRAEHQKLCLAFHVVELTREVGTPAGSQPVALSTAFGAPEKGALLVPPGVHLLA